MIISSRERFFTNPMGGTACGCCCSARAEAFSDAKTRAYNHGGCMASCYNNANANANYSTAYGRAPW